MNLCNSFYITFQSAKLPQYSGKDVFAKMFENCKTPKEEQAVLKVFEKPTQEQFSCLCLEFFKIVDMLNSDGTVNTDKLSQQFLDYERPVPEEVATFVGINAYKSSTLADKVVPYMKKHKEDIKFVFYGNDNENFEWEDLKEIN